MMKLNNFRILHLIVLLQFFLFPSYGQSIKMTSDFKSGMQFYNFNDDWVTQTFSPSFAGLISVHLNEKSFEVVASCGFSLEIINFFFNP